MVDASERLQVLLMQEATIYRTSDYITKMQVNAGCPDPCRESSGMVKNGSPCSPKKRKSWETLDGTTGPSCNEEPQQGIEESSLASGGSQMNKHWREKICKWAYEVIDHFNLRREVVSIAMNHLDRYLGVFPATVDKDLFQLLAMTCLYLSVKLNEYRHLIIPDSKSSMDTILQLSRGLFTLDQMEKMEFDVLQRLQWHVHPPTSQIFVKHLLFFLSIEDSEVHDMAQFMVELSVMDYFFVAYKQSEVAIAAILNAMDRLYPHSSSRLHFPLQSDLFEMNSPGVQACRDRLALIYAQANDQSPGESDNTPTKVATEPIHRTTSPVSVITGPHPAHFYHGSAQHSDDIMDTEYSDDEDL